MYGNYGSSLYGSDLYSSSSTYSDALNRMNSVASSEQMMQSWATPVLIISIVAAILIFFLFLTKKNEGKFKGFLGWMYDFLSFKKLTVEAILKIAYIAVALYITIMSFTTIGLSFGYFLGILIGGNILARVIYEVLLILVIICKNTTEINNKLSQDKKED